jgi:orotate phosphoribosyltransferase
MTVESAKAQFIALAIDLDALRFGEFELKSGRISPYFFNAGRFSTGSALSVLGQCYASVLASSGIAFDTLFGPAYKGIPLAAAVAVSLSRDHHRDVPYVYNRKEAKQHGEGGVLVGDTLSGQVVIVDDVITAGTAVRESVQMIESAGATPRAVLIGLDRCERGTSDRSAVQQVEDDTGMSVLSVITLHDVIGYLEQREDAEQVLAEMSRYRDAYGV